MEKEINKEVKEANAFNNIFENTEDEVKIICNEKIFDNGYLKEPSFIYFLKEFYPKSILSSFRNKHYKYAVYAYDICLDGLEEKDVVDLDQAIWTAKQFDNVKKVINSFERELKKEKQKEKEEEEYYRLVEEERQADNKRPFKDKFEEAVICLRNHGVNTPMREFLVQGHSFNPKIKKVVSKELEKENRDFSSIIAKDYHKKEDNLTLNSVFSMKDYLNNYMKVFIYGSVASKKGLLSMDEITNTYNNSIKLLSNEISNNYFKESIVYNHKYQEMIDNKKEVYNLNSKDRMNLLKNLKESIIESLDNKYDTKYEHLLLSTKQKYTLMKEAVYNQSFLKKIFMPHKYFKEKQELIEVSNRLCSSLHISKEELSNTLDTDSQNYKSFIKDSKELCNLSQNDLNDIIKEVSAEGVFKKEIKVEEVKANKSIDKEINTLKELNLEVKVNTKLAMSN